MKKKYHTQNLWRRVMARVMALALVVGLFPAGMAQSASAVELPEDEIKEMWEIALENGYTHYDTIDLCGGNSHMQGICVDDKMEYMYFSYTSALAKVDMKTGKVVGSVGGFGEGSFGTPGGAHLGCLAYYDGKIYGSLEYKEPGAKFFIAVFDEDAITEVGMDMKEMDTGVYGILLEEPTSDFRDPLNDVVSGANGFAVNEEKAGHKFGCSGIDGVTFAPMPGSDDDKMYLFVAYGVYGNNDYWKGRYDNNYNVLQVYDPEDFDQPYNESKGTGDSVLRRFTYERGLSTDYEESEVLTATDTLYAWTGTTSYGAQNMEYDKDTGDIVLYTYAPQQEWSKGHTLYVIDGSKVPVEREIEVGQSNTNSDQDAHDAAVAKAEEYKVDGKYPIGKHGVLKCICGNDCQPTVCGDTGITAMVCGGALPETATYGIASIGGGYYYIVDGATTASLFKRDDNYNFTRVTLDRPINAFNDIVEGDWYYKAVDYALTEGIMSGTSTDTFAPNATLTRAMVAQMLYSLEGKPAADRADFADGAEDAWYADAISWAAGEGIVSGYGDTFGPNDPITREQLALILYGYAQMKEYDTTQGGMSIREFSDYTSISGWALEGLDWAVNAGLLSGKGNNTLAPTAGATRAEVAQIFMMFCQEVAKQSK